MLKRSWEKFLANRIKMTLDDDLFELVQIEAEKLGWSEAAVIRYMLRQAFDLQRGGIGDLARKLISDGRTNAETLEAVRAKFPDAATSSESIAWYRSQMRREGLDVLTDREARNA